MSVSKRFDAFLANLKLTDPQKVAGESLKEAVIRTLNRYYYSSESSTLRSQFVGSWGKQTRIRPPRDVDVLFTLPISIHTRFQGRAGNKQSQLLQEVKGVLASTYSNTAIRGDGPVVLVPFTGYKVEIIPAFELTTGRHWVCVTTNGGSYKEADYAAEKTAIATSNSASAGNTRDLIRMMKRWQSYCNVPLKSFYIELLAIDFLSNWGNRGKSTVYYDWMCRDFFGFIIGRQNTFLYAPGTYDMMYLGNAWGSKAITASAIAHKACIHEGNSHHTLAGEEWQKLFGADIPRYV